MPCVHQHAVRQRPRLLSGRLIGLVEVRAYLRMFVQEDAVEVRGEGLAALLKEGNGRADDGAVFGGDHAVGLSCLGCLLYPYPVPERTWLSIHGVRMGLGQSDPRCLWVIPTPKGSQ